MQHCSGTAAIYAHLDKYLLSLLHHASASIYNWNISNPQTTVKITEELLQWLALLGMSLSCGSADGKTGWWVQNTSRNFLFSSCFIFFWTHTFFLPFFHCQHSFRCDKWVPLIIHTAVLNHMYPFSNKASKQPSCWWGREHGLQGQTEPPFSLCQMLCVDELDFFQISAGHRRNVFVEVWLRLYYENMWGDYVKMLQAHDICPRHRRTGRRS